MLKIRHAKDSDMENVYKLSNDDIVRMNSIHKEHIKWEEHIKWFSEKLNSPNVIFYILEFMNKFAGYAHIDLEKNNQWIITIHISSQFRNNGLGAKFLNYICQNNSDKIIVSYIKKDNIASQRIFEKNNFIFIFNKRINNEIYNIYFNEGDSLTV